MFGLVSTGNRAARGHRTRARVRRQGTLTGPREPQAKKEAPFASASGARAANGRSRLMDGRESPGAAQAQQVGQAEADQRQATGFGHVRAAQGDADVGGPDDTLTGPVRSLPLRPDRASSSEKLWSDTAAR